MLAQRDSALDVFHKLRVWQVSAGYEDTSSTFLARFQATAASLEPDDRIKLEVVYTHESMELLKAGLTDPQANKICALQWNYRGEEDVKLVIPLLINNCPELASLQVNFTHHSAFDFAFSMLEHPSNKIKVLEMLPYNKGNLPSFFAALEQSQVLALSIFSHGSPEFAQGLAKYLAKDLLVRLNVQQAPSKMMMSLAGCTRLAELKISQCTFSQPTAFPQSITKLVFNHCEFVGGVDWTFLVGSNLRELDLLDVSGVDGNQLGSALATHLRATGLDRLRFRDCDSDFADENLAAVGVELGRIKKLDFDNQLNKASIKLIGLALQSPNSELRELALPYHYDTASNIATYFAPALRHPNCNLAKLSLWANGGANKLMVDKLYSRRALFALLQGQQVRRLYCPLQRLPVEMFRLVGQVLM